MADEFNIWEYYNDLSVRHFYFPQGSVQAGIDQFLTFLDMARKDGDVIVYRPNLSKDDFPEDKEVRDRLQHQISRITELEQQLAQKDERVAEMQVEIDNLEQDRENKQREVEQAYGRGWNAARNNPDKYL